MLRTYDLNSILRVLKDPIILPYIIDDGSLLEGDLGLSSTVLNSDSCYVLMPNKDSLFMFLKRNTITYEVHVSILKSERKNGRKLGILCFDWMFDNTKCRKIVASVPSYNRVCLMYARANGMKNEGISTKSFQLNGELFDMYNFGITEEEFRKCQL